MVKTHGHQTAMPNLDRLGLTPLCDLRFITWARQIVAGIRLADETVAYVVDLIRATRNHPALQYGASPRAANMLAAASRAAAVARGARLRDPGRRQGAVQAAAPPSRRPLAQRRGGRPRGPTRCSTRSSPRWRRRDEPSSPRPSSPVPSPLPHREKREKFVFVFPPSPGEGGREGTGEGARG